MQFDQAHLLMTYTQIIGPTNLVSSRWKLRDIVDRADNLIFLQNYPLNLYSFRSKAKLFQPELRSDCAQIFILGPDVVFDTLTEFKNEPLAINFIVFFIKRKKKKILSYTEKTTTTNFQFL